MGRGYGFVVRGCPSSIPKRINFTGFKGKETHKGVVSTSQSLEDTLKELEKDYDAVIFKGVKLLPEEREEVRIYDANTHEQIY